MPLSFRELSWLLGAAAVVLLFGAASLPREPLGFPPPSTSHLRAADAAKVAFALSGNELGFIRPCGCSKPKLGGIDRRAQLLSAWRAEHPQLIPLGLGNMLNANGPQARIKFEHFLLAMMAMEYQAFFPGPKEYLLGASTLREQKEFAAFPLVALDAKDASGALLFEPSVRLAGTPYIATGLSAATDGLADVQIAPAAEVLPAFFAGLNPEVDRVLLAFNGDEAAAKAIAALVPEAFRPHTTLVFGGSYDAPAKAPGEDWPIPAYSVGSKGRNLARLELGDLPQFVATRLEEELGGREDVAAILEGYREAVKGADLLASVPRNPAKVKYLGDQNCRECHESIVDTLLTTPHQHAWKTLVDYGDHHDPECVSCHVTGYGESTGFLGAQATPEHVNVNCEACHGPGGDHVEFGDPMPRAKPPETYCRTCHDPDNSPKFDFKVYWPKIQHPKK